jgi:hypothetical protein
MERGEWGSAVNAVSHADADLAMHHMMMIVASCAGRKHVQISFDDLNRIRILDAEHFKQTETLAEECTQFNDSTSASCWLAHCTAADTLLADTTLQA